MQNNGPPPITVRIQDATSKEPKPLFDGEYAVPYEWEMDAIDVLERAFVFAQKADPKNPDPFIFALRYFGYSRDEKYPGYLGYEIESFSDPRSGASYPNDKQHFWELLVDGQIATVGADTLRPEPGSTLTWSYQTLENALPSLRSKGIAARRNDR